MFGWRLVRSTEWTAAQVKIERLYERVVQLSAEAGAKGAEATMALARLNAMEHESALLRHKLSGIPAVAPSVSPGGGSIHGTPNLADLPMQSQVGAGMDLYSDVGDRRAKELAERNLLHDDVQDDFNPPTAGALTADL